MTIAIHEEQGRLAPRSRPPGLRTFESSRRHAPTGYTGADFCNIRPGQTIAVWGCGGVGLMAQRSAY
jgi:hypothetical protein